MYKLRSMDLFCERKFCIYYFEMSTKKSTKIEGKVPNPFSKYHFINKSVINMSLKCCEHNRTMHTPVHI